jgi:hypothetical protein
MLASPLSYSLNSSDIIYSAKHESLRQLYLYDTISELSNTINFPKAAWYEFQFIHNEQFLVHVWQDGIYLYDTVTKKTQAMVAAEKSRFFNFIIEDKKLIFQENRAAVLFDPKTKQKSKLVDQVSEMLIDKQRNSFIVIHDSIDSPLAIYIKNKSVFSHPNVYNINFANQENDLLFIEDHDTTFSVYILSLNDFKIKHHSQYNGTLESLNIVGDLCQISCSENDTFSFFILNTKTFKSTLLLQQNYTFNVYSRLAPDGDTLALLIDDEEDSSIELIDLENSIF